MNSKPKTKDDYIRELEAENRDLREALAGEQSARVALEGVVGDRLDEIVKLLRGRGNG